MRLGIFPRIGSNPGALVDATTANRSKANPSRLSLARRRVTRRSMSAVLTATDIVPPIPELYWLVGSPSETSRELQPAWRTQESSTKMGRAYLRAVSRLLGPPLLVSAPAAVDALPEVHA